MSTGVVFGSTGGNKIVRAIRSLRRTEPDIPIHVVLDVASNTWKKNSNPSLSWFEQQPGVKVRCFENRFQINGILNECMRWMKELAHGHGCLFHDDIIFSPFQEHFHHISTWIERLETDSLLRESSGLTFSVIEAIVLNEGNRRSQEEWNSMDLESESFWNLLLSGIGKPTSPKGLSFKPEYVISDRIKTWTRLGPTGQIVPIKAWEEIGGFDETFGLWYDGQYPIDCFLKGFSSVYVVPSVPHLHLHNQSIGWADPAIGLFGQYTTSFKNRYGEDFFSREDWRRWANGFYE